MIKFLNRIKSARKGLAFYLIVWIIPVIICIFTVLLYYDYIVSRELLEKNVKQNTRNLTNSSINKSEGIFNAIEKIAINSSIYIRQKEIGNEEIFELLKEIVADNKDIYGSCMAFKPILKKGNLYYNAPYCWENIAGIHFKNLASKDYMYTEWDWYSLPASKRCNVWSEPYFDKGGGNIMMTTYSVPIYWDYSDSSTLAGVLTIDVSLDWLNKIIKDIKIYDTGYAFLLSSSGKIIAHPDSSLLMKHDLMELATASGDKSFIEIASDMIRGKTGFRKLHSGFVKESSWIYYSPLEKNGWSLAFVFPESELYEDLHILNSRLLIIFIVGIIILLVFILVLSRMIAQPIRKLADIMNKEGKDFISEKIPDIKGSYEILSLNKSFKTLQSELISYIDNLNKLNTAKQRIDSELNIARNLQQSMLPHFNNSVKFSSRISIDGKLQPAREVGGDFYDFFKLDDSHLFFAIGDVSGKGMGAALFMSMTITLLRAYTNSKGIDIHEIIEKTSEYLEQNNEQNFFVTLFVGILDVETGIIDFINAGHNYPYILSKKENIKVLTKIHLPPIGIIKRKEITSGTVEIEKGDTFFLYTDGLTDAMNTDKIMYSQNRLTQFISETKDRTTEKLLSEVWTEINTYTKGAEQFDDITLLAFQYCGNESCMGNILFSKELEISYDNFDKIRFEIEENLNKKNIDSHSINSLILVLEEIITNILKYGIKDGIINKLRINVTSLNDCLYVELTDNSKPFDYLTNMNISLSDKSNIYSIGGRGLILIGSITKEFNYNRKSEENIINFKINIKGG